MLCSHCSLTTFSKKSNLTWKASFISCSTSPEFADILLNIIFPGENLIVSGPLFWKTNSDMQNDHILIYGHMN